ncbi:hypothetical protein R3P38DRAFT_3260940 [Favolaschia claudopus]|uniref:Integrase core domain-containing protein n=1 Tax=Favolaschia claudopus TaxID=2862362 RepID=A0AAW0CR53_9AGAR
MKFAFCLSCSWQTRFPLRIASWNTALRTQLGDTARLRLQRDEAFRLLEAAEPHRAFFPPAEFATLQQSVATMADLLDEACHMSTPAGRPLHHSHHRVLHRSPLGSNPTCTVTGLGRRGRPKKQINPAFLQEALSLRGPSGVASVLNCHPRTVRRAALDQGIATPGVPVYPNERLADSTQQRTYTSASRSAPSTLTDAQLDAAIGEILDIFPAFGRNMIAVHGAPGEFGDRSIHRKAYKVAGANSLWHHDGQHGFKIVIHCFIDGKSRFITGIHAVNNNRAQTVLDLFLYAVSRYGTPSRARGDHGTENILVAAWMEEQRGSGRGSYILGRSVHNTRIERLWYDVTHGFGQKWKNFFHDLEINHGLNPRSPGDIWLLHHLFLDSINQDAQEWAEAWNSHKVQIKRERKRSLRDMFVFSMVQDGPRGLGDVVEPVDEPVDDIASYGVDWEVANDPRLMRHLLEENPQDWEDENPFHAAPSQLSDVPCRPPNCPFTVEQVALLDRILAERVDVTSRNMVIRRTVWCEAFHICSQFVPQL